MVTASLILKDDPEARDFYLIRRIIPEGHGQIQQGKGEALSLVFMSDEQEELSNKRLGVKSRETLQQGRAWSCLCGQQMSEQRKCKRKILLSSSTLNTSSHQVHVGEGAWGGRIGWSRVFLHQAVLTPQFTSFQTLSTWSVGPHRSRARSQKTAPTSDNNLKSRLSVIWLSD